MHLHAVQAQFFRVLEGNELLSEAVLVVADIVGYLVVYLQTVVIFVVTVLLLLAADVADHVLKVYMSFELVLVEKVAGTEPAVRMQESHIAELIDIALLLMPVERFEGVQLLLLKHTCLFLDADIAE
jgi:hypothetical protein